MVPEAVFVTVFPEPPLNDKEPPTEIVPLLLRFGPLTVRMCASVRIPPLFTVSVPLIPKVTSFEIEVFDVPPMVMLEPLHVPDPEMLCEPEAPKVMFATLMALLFVICEPLNAKDPVPLSVPATARSVPEPLAMVKVTLLTVTVPALSIVS